MTKIKLPGYRTIVPNEIYGKSAGFLCHPEKGKVPTTKTITFSKFRAPTQDEVIDFIRIIAKGIDLFSLKKDEPSKKDPEIIYFLKSLPQLLVKDISKGDKNGLNFLRNHYPVHELQDGRVYLNALNIVVPNPALDYAKKLVSKEGTIDYYSAIMKNSVREWYLRIRLLEDGKFPDSSELEYLIDRGVKNSDVFSAMGDFKDYQNIANQIRLFNNVFGSTELISQILDTSSRSLEIIASSTVKETAEYIREMSKRIKQFLGEIGEQQPKQKKPFNYTKDFSLN